MKARALALLFMLLAITAIAQTSPPAPKLAPPGFKDSSLLRTYLQKSALPERLDLYKSWLAQTALDPGVADAVAGFLIADFIGLTTAQAKEMMTALGSAFPRGAAFWGTYEKYRSDLACALLDRPEAELAKDVLAAIAGLTDGISFVPTEARNAKIFAVWKDPSYVPSGNETRLIWNAAWNGSTTGKSAIVKRRLASQLILKAQLSLWTYSLRSPYLRADDLAALFPGAAVPKNETRLILPALLSVGLPSVGTGVPMRVEVKTDLAANKLVRSSLGQMKKSQDPALLAFLSLTETGTAWKPPDPAMLKTAEDWEAGLSLWLSSSRNAPALPESDLISLLDRTRPTLAAVAAYLLASHADSQPAIKALSDMVQDRSVRDPSLLVCAMGSLSVLAAKDSVYLLIILVDHPLSEVREEACRDLVRIGDPRAVPALLTRVNDAEKGVRLAAIRGLGEMRDSRAVDALSVLLLSATEDDDIKVAAAEALGKIGDMRMIQVFVRFLLIPSTGSNSDLYARIAAVRALGQAKERSAIDALLKNIDPNTSSELNYYCIKALGKIADTAGLKPLYALAVKGLPRWTEGGPSRSSVALFWALLPLDPAMVRAFYLDYWNKSNVPGTVRIKLDNGIWFVALYLLRNPPLEATDADRKKWNDYLDSGLLAAIGWEVDLVAEALKNFPWRSAFLKAASIVGSLGLYEEQWICSAFVENPDPVMIPTFRLLLEKEDDFIVYTALAALDHLIPKLPSPLPAEIDGQLRDIRAKLPLLTPAQLQGVAKNWRDSVQRKLNALFGPA